MCAVFIAFIACDIAFIAFVACDIAFISFIACDNAGGTVLRNVVRPDDFERWVLQVVHRCRCGGGGIGRGRRRGLDGAAEARHRRRCESAAAASAVGRRGGGEPWRRRRRRRKRRRRNDSGWRPRRYSLPRRARTRMTPARRTPARPRMCIPVCVPVYSGPHFPEFRIFRGISGFRRNTCRN